MVSEWGEPRSPKIRIGNANNSATNLMKEEIYLYAHMLPSLPYNYHQSYRYISTTE
jgi:hypothetical protein